MKAILKKTLLHEVEIVLSGKDIAELFWSLDEDGQSEFFNHLGGEPLVCRQLHAVMLCEDLAPEGRKAMKLIGEYAEPPQS